MADERIAVFRPAVIHPFPIAARFHQASTLEMREVARHFGLHEPQGIGQFADAGFARREQIQQTQAGPVGQCPKEKRWLAISR